ncbi:MAG: hypothetical protein IJI27_08115 [Oscillospiraceae bacterium]|nr:hypothetical protein [Oscillospiraceae bacterium]
MKKYLKPFLMLMLVLAMVFVLCACTVPAVQVQNEDGTQTIYGVLIEQTVNTVYRLIWAGTLAFGAWVLDKIGKNAKLKNLSLAIQLVLEMTRQTAEELQQTIVGDLKAKRPGGKLTPEDVDDLGFRLLNTVKIKVDVASQELIKAAGIDLDALITGECEAFLNRLKSYAIPAPVPVSEPGEEQEDE